MCRVGRSKEGNAYICVFRVRLVVSLLVFVCVLICQCMCVAYDVVVTTHCIQTNSAWINFCFLRTEKTRIHLRLNRRAVWMTSGMYLPLHCLLFSSCADDCIRGYESLVDVFKKYHSMEPLNPDVIWKTLHILSTVGSVALMHWGCSLVHVFCLCWHR